MMSPSVQHLIDCEEVLSDETGGFVEQAYLAMRDSGVATVHDYPTRITRSGVVRRACRHCHHTVRPTVRIQNFRHVPIFVFALAHTLEHEGTLAIRLTCGTEEFDGYRGGVTRAGIFRHWEANEEAGISPHYMVLLGCGLDVDSGRFYWLLRNSDGPNWGEDGLMKLDIDMTDFIEEAWIPEGVYHV